MIKIENIEKFLRGRLELDCTLVQLIPFDSSKNNETLTGPGLISLHEKGYFELKFFFSESFSFEETFEGINWTAGKIINDEYYYNLIAHDVLGNTWYAEKFILDRNSGPNGSVVLCKFPEIRLSETLNRTQSKQSAQIYFNECIDVPFNTISIEQTTVGEKVRKKKIAVDLAQFTADGIEFCIETKEHYSVIFVESEEKELTDVFISRIIETFQFVFSYSEPFSVLRIAKNNNITYKFKAVTKQKLRSRILPPKQFINEPRCESVWVLFDRYLSFVTTNEKDIKHPVSELCYSNLESGKSSLELQAITLSISIESLLRYEFSNFYNISDSLKKNIACSSQIILESSLIDNDFRQRLLGSITSMKNARAKDILFALRDSGLIDKQLIKVYSNLRNKSAHGVNDTGADIQNYYNQVSAVLVLFNQLIFLLIRYNGEYTDYGTYGFPTKLFEINAL